MGALFRAPGASGSLVYQTMFRPRLDAALGVAPGDERQQNVSVAAFFITIE
jgi:hypothetical protein